VPVLQEDDLVVLADAQLGVALGDVLHLSLLLRGPLLDRRHHPLLERLLHAPADGPPEQAHPGRQGRARDVLTDVLGEISGPVEVQVGAAAGL
jgi:hypothetical protein